MLLAEALARRAEADERLRALTQRLTQGALIQEGDTPAEDPAELLAETAHLLTEIETLVRRINHTNSQTPFEGATLTDALARRDATLRARRLYSQVADAAAARQDRYSRSEVRFVPTVDVAQLRKMADDAAKAYRELDTKIQQANWSTQLL
ncbi:DIP1984 family protein [Corynebacterium sp. Q4381]|uniref:DIP1984 family protein n=1 Tax=Corynebacterium sp. Marseille-Q4381 TaxID=3121597 RepID=UPI002FE65D83